MYDPQEAEEVTHPNGHVVIDDLPNSLANEYLMDEIICGEIGGKPYAIAAMDAARRGDFNEAGRILMLCRERAGESDAALSDWERWMENWDGA